LETNLLIEILLPLSLATIMYGMGLTLRLNDFKRILIYPKAVFTGLVSQLLLLPAIAFALVYSIDVKPEYAVGLILIAACPGGPTSNLIAFLGKCDTALSISLTALSSLITIFTIPIIVNLGLELFYDSGQIIRLPVLRTILQIMVITVIPVGFGMFTRSKIPVLAERAIRPVKLASTLFIILVIVAVVFNDREMVLPAFKDTGLWALILNVVTMATGFLTGRLMGLPMPQKSSISIETGIQNGTLAIAIAASSTLLNSPEMAIAPAVYSIIMFFTGGAVAWLFSRLNHKHALNNRH